MTDETAPIRYKMIVEYDGAPFAGWQKQPNVPSVQQHIEEAIEAFSGQQASVQCAGRTDAGVHGLGQVLHVDLNPFKRAMSGYEITKAINAHMMEVPISILSCEEVSSEFNARFDAINKLYRYRILQRTAFPAIEIGRVWHVKRPLDIVAMQKGAQHLLGHHDFSSFRAAECQAKHPMRTLDRLDITASKYDPAGGLEIIIETEAQSFIHHQVRNMVGTLTLVGEGKWQPDDMKRVLEARDRTQAGPTAPACGLYLARIDYP